MKNMSGIAMLKKLINFYDFSNIMTVKEIKEYLQEQLWIDEFDIKFRTFNVVDDDKLIGKVSVALMDAPIDSIEEDYDMAKTNMFKLAFAFWDANGCDIYSKPEGEKWSLHRLICDEPIVVTNTKYTRLDNDFLKKVKVALPFQKYVDNVTGKDHQINIFKEAIIKAAESMQVTWMIGMRIDNIK